MVRCTRILCGVESESINHLFFNCVYTRDIWHNLKLHLMYTRDIVSPTDVIDMWAGWRKTWARQHFSMQWYHSVMTVCWTVWNERNNQIFSQKCRSSSVLSDVINSFISWLVNLPKRRWKTFVRRKTKGVAGRRAVLQQEARNSIAADNGEVLDVDGGHTDSGVEDGERTASEAIAAKPLRAQTSTGVEFIIVD